MAKKFTYILEFDAKNGQFINAMRSNAKQVGNVDRKIQSAQKSAQTAQSTFNKLGGILAGAFAVKNVISYLKTSTQAYDVQAKAEQGLLVALKGRSDVQQRLIRQAGELQKKTLFGDEETIKAQALIAAFVKEGDQIERVIPLVQDLATAKNMDLAAASDLVSKTLGSSTNALARYGIQVEGNVGSTERLESLVNSLNDAFGGQAESAAKVGTGALTQLDNAYGDLNESIGRLVISQQNQEDSFVKMLTNMTSELSGFVGDMATFSDAGLSFMQSFISSIITSDEDIEKLKSALVIKPKYDKGTIGALNQELKELNEQLLNIDASDKEAVITQKKKITAVKEQIRELNKLGDAEGSAMSVTNKLKELNKELIVAQKNATQTQDVDLFIKGQEDVKKLKKQIDEVQEYLKNLMPRDTTSYQTIETKQVSSVTQDGKLDTSSLSDMTPMLEKNAQIIESLRTGWTSFGDDFNSVIQTMSEGGQKITDVHMLAGDMVNNLMAVASEGVSSFKEWASAVRDAAMSAINAFIAEGVAGAVSTALAKSGIPFPLNMIAGAIAATGATALLNSVIPKFEFGGVVPGNSFYGDKMLVRVNSGEEILRRDDPRHAANMSGFSGTRMQTQTQVKVMIPTTRIRKGDIYISYHEAAKELEKRT